jgi:hypothetical protein
MDTYPAAYLAYYAEPAVIPGSPPQIVPSYYTFSLGFEGTQQDFGSLPATYGGISGHFITTAGVNGTNVATLPDSGAGVCTITDTYTSTVQ